MFTITKDKDADETKPQGTNANAVGVVGPSDATLTSDEIKNHVDGQKFRMLDGDSTVVYEGVYVETPDSDQFEPLDSFGEPNYGCSTIQYRENGKWVEL